LLLSDEKYDNSFIKLVCGIHVSANLLLKSQINLRGYAGSYFVTFMQ